MHDMWYVVSMCDVMWYVVGRYKSLEIVFYVLLGVAPSIIVYEMVRLGSCH